MPLSCLFSRSRASIAVSTTTPISAVSAAFTILSQRASVGTKNIPSPMYSSGSSSNPSLSAISSSYLALKQSLIYLRNTKPSTTLLYSPASRLPRNSLAESQRICSIVLFVSLFFDFFAIIKLILQIPCSAIRLIQH